ncbi:MAG: membrane protein insertion efficiency factor YidD [Candidatus Daviesbacteria bacterium]|nr:membrane protein insertion efficiency factor YidD [Candidatus Daviesbacteria bacterium]
MKKLLINIIEFYQNFLSFDKGVLAIFAPGGACRYNLSCSEYTKQKIGVFGVFRGIRLGLKRIWSCR